MFVVTGGSSGIGRALAQALANQNKAVLIVGRREKELQKTAEYSSLISICCTDLASESGQKKLISQLANIKHIEGLIHNAGIIEPIVSLKSLSKPAWDAIMKTNLEAPLFLTQSLLKQLQDGRVLHIGSGAAYFPVAGWAPYCISKAALAMLTSCWQLEIQDPAFASVMPGIIDTNMQAQIRNADNMNEEKQNFFKKLKQEKRLLTVETVAAFLTWLLLEIDVKTYSSQEWDIYDKSHHKSWLVDPFEVPEVG
jgi:NAD(P)-dependent dehydrogenase (short-subunit alcohol dehydrogenase family)